MIDTEDFSMCLAVPMKITAIDGFLCTCEARGIEREVSLFMMRDDGLEIGDNILVHVGYAIQKVSEQEAAESWQLFDQMLAAEAQ
jgi:hydrogenase expression/formation protein HypC